MISISSKANSQQSELDCPDSETLLLGELASAPRSIGFQVGKQVNHLHGKVIEYQGDAHLVTVAPTRSGKGTGVVIPNMLNYRGPVVCFDPKGEAYMVTSRRRSKLGPVVKLDPFGVIDEHTDGLNPLDILTLPGSDTEGDAQALASLIASGATGLREPFWDVNGSGLSSGLIAYAGEHVDPKKRNLMTVIEAISTDDVVYNLAVILDTVGNKINKMARREIATFLQMPDITRGGVLATAQSYCKAFLSKRVGRTLRASSFPLQDVVDGRPMTIYMILPPDKLHSHRSLLKLWVGTLFNAILSRKHRPPLRTLFLLDEVAQLEHFPLLESLITLSAGYGVWVWMILQDLAQLQTHYPLSWKTLLNNCGVVQTFGIYNRIMATQWSEHLDCGAHQLRNLEADEQILAMHGQPELRCKRLNYLTHSRFENSFDSNRFFAPKQSPPTRIETSTFS